MVLDVFNSSCLVIPLGEFQVCFAKAREQVEKIPVLPSSTPNALSAGLETKVCFNCYCRAAVAAKVAAAVVVVVAVKLNLYSTSTK